MRIRAARASCVWPFPRAGARAVKGRAPARAQSALPLTALYLARATLSQHMRSYSRESYFVETLLELSSR
jgi:hypothetical protein